MSLIRSITLLDCGLLHDRQRRVCGHAQESRQHSQNSVYCEVFMTDCQAMKSQRLSRFSEQRFEHRNLP